MKRQTAAIFTIAMLIVLLVSITCTQSPQDKRESDSIQAEVDKIFAKWDKPDSPGCALGVIKDGRLIYKRGYGMANLDYNIPITSESVFYIASTSKQFTAASIALLVDRGEISLDDDVRKYIPEIPEYGTPVTIRHLVHHTSGLRDYLGLMALAGLSYQDYFNNDDAIQILSRQKSLNFKPGDEHLYSNSGYVAMAEIVKRVSGKSLREYAEENIFQPLGMKNTHFNDDRSLIVKNRVISYQPIAEGGFKRFLKNFDAVGDGDLLTTVEDLYRWDQNFYNDKLGEKEFIDLLLTRGKLNNSKELGYAFGLFHGEYKGLKIISHGGGMLGFRTQMIRFPEHKFTVICLSNLANVNPTMLAQKVTDLYLEDHFEEKSPEAKPSQKEAVSVDPATYDSYLGKYQLEMGLVITITKENDKLIAQAEGQPKMELVPLSRTKFLLKEQGYEVDFHKDETGKVTKFVLHAMGQEMTAKKFEPLYLSTRKLAEYEGDYYSDELEATYEFISEEGRLFVKVGRIPKTRLEFWQNDAVSCPMFKGVFERDKQNKITGFTLEAGRVRNLKFVRK
ncbi:MAG: serine hydrolase [Candidatus Aminicenantes bacterium]|nr:MAG: serine hydrolase [Candidatus Aminicenantes bacterium]